MSNYKAIGYMILAMKSLGRSQQEITDMEHQMLNEMDTYTEDEAKDVYMSFPS